LFLTRFIILILSVQSFKKMKNNKKFDNSVNRTTDIENINEVNVAENDLPLLSEPTEVA